MLPLFSASRMTLVFLCPIYLSNGFLPETETPASNGDKGHSKNKAEVLIAFPFDLLLRIKMNNVLNMQK